MSRELNKLIIGGDVVTPEGILKDSSVLVEGTRIRRIGGKMSLDPGCAVEVFDAKGGYILPGLIDIHIHCDVQDVAEIASRLPAHGVTGFLATLKSLPRWNLLKEVKGLREFARRPQKGARILGIHVEGPYLNPRRPGAHKVEYLHVLTDNEIDAVVHTGNGLVRIVTLAPELKHAQRIIRKLSRMGIIPAAGHSEASYAKIHESVRNGLRHIVHLYNAMRGVAHRDPGILEAGLLMDEISCEIICDGAHLSCEAVKLVLKCKNIDKIIMVSDAVVLDPERDRLKSDGLSYIVQDGAVRLKESGRLAGGCTGLIEGIKRVRRWFKRMPLHLIVNMASLSPAGLLGIRRRKGSIQLGKDADLTVVDSNFNVLFTFVKGELVYYRGSCR